MEIKDYVSFILDRDLRKLTLFERMVVTEEQRFLRDKFILNPVLSHIKFLDEKITDSENLTPGSTPSLINFGRTSRRNLMQFHVGMYNDIKPDKDITYRDIYKHIDTSDEYKKKMNEILFERVKFMKSNSTK